MAFNNTIEVRWQGLTYRPFSLLSTILPGLSVTQEETDPRLAHYEVERLFLGGEEDEWVSLGSFQNPYCTVSATFEKAVKVRIRAVLRDGTRTGWATSGYFPLYGMRADFSELNNALLLGFV